MKSIPVQVWQLMVAYALMMAGMSLMVLMWAGVLAMVLCFFSPALTGLKTKIL